MKESEIIRLSLFTGVIFQNTGANFKIESIVKSVIG